MPVLVAPPQEPPSRADVVVVLSPPQPWRVAWARELVAAGDADAMLVFVDRPQDTPVCAGHEPVPVTCVRPDPFSTRGEARALRDAMAAQGWSSATVVTAAPNVLRARLLIGRCVVRGVQVVGRREPIGPGRWVLRYAWQAGGWAKAAVHRSC